MAILNDQLQLRETQSARAKIQPTAFDRCACRHIAAHHGPANGWNLAGPCLSSRCECKSFGLANTPQVTPEPAVVDDHVVATDATEQDGLFDLPAGPNPTARKGRRSARTAPDPTPTNQQAAIVAAFKGGGDLVIQAGAGAGKTSTLRMCANADRRRGAYIVFGKANAEEAKKKFPSHVEARTAHGFAYKAIGHRYRDRMYRSSGRVGGRQVAAILGINDVISLGIDTPLITARQQACLAIGAVRRYTMSADPEIGPWHVPKFRGVDKPEARAALASAIVPFAGKAWGDLRSLDGKLRFEPDHYLKMWSLTDPQFDVDYVLLDEAQDADPAIAAVVNGQRSAQRIMVGDDNQAIYGWRGAINAMASFAGQRLALSQSFRFGPAIAEEANKWLDVLGSGLRLTGFDPIPSRLQRMPVSDAVLCRTNGQVIAEIGEYIGRGLKVAIAGGAAPLRRMAEAAADLQAGKGTDHPDLYTFTTWDEVRAYVNEEDDGADLRTFVTLVDSLGADHVLTLVASLTSEDDADVVVSTAHKAKGREWKTVRVAADFPEPKRSEDDPNPEISPTVAMLAYVTVTRAQSLLDRSGLSWVDKWVTE